MLFRTCILRDFPQTHGAGKGAGEGLRGCGKPRSAGGLAKGGRTRGSCGQPGMFSAGVLDRIRGNHRSAGGLAPDGTGPFAVTAGDPFASGDSVPGRPRCPRRPRGFLLTGTLRGAGERPQAEGSVSPGEGSGGKGSFFPGEGSARRGVFEAGRGSRFSRKESGSARSARQTAGRDRNRCFVFGRRAGKGGPEKGEKTG